MCYVINYYIYYKLLLIIITVEESLFVVNVFFQFFTRVLTKKKLQYGRVNINRIQRKMYVFDESVHYVELGRFINAKRWVKYSDLFVWHD